MTVFLRSISIEPVVNDLGWVVVLIAINLSLCAVVLASAWQLQVVKRKVMGLTNTLTDTEKELSAILASSPDRLSFQVERLQSARKTYQTWLSNLNRIQQFIKVLRGFLAVVNR